MILTNGTIDASTIQFSKLKNTINNYKDEIINEKVVINALLSYFVDIIITLNTIQVSCYTLEQCVNVIKEIR
jgi:hypothetical protein